MQLYTLIYENSYGNAATKIYRCAPIDTRLLSITQVPTMLFLLISC